MDLFAFRKPKNELESDEGESKNVPFVPEEMWIKCPKCNTMLLTTDMEENLHVCTKCNHHFRMNGRDRVEMLADKDTFVEFDADLSSHNILDFPGYDEKLEKARKTGAKESVICGECKMNGIDTVLCVMDPTFMMGSMGVITGEKITRAFEYATENAMPIVVCTAAGGARMQEGILSLMQMAKTSGAVKRHSDAGNLYITVLTDPTTGGVTASFAMEGDIILAEPDCLVAFAGPRVIEQTIRQKLPKDFQTSEFVLQKGFIDSVVSRNDLKSTLVKLLTGMYEPDEGCILINGIDRNRFARSEFYKLFSVVFQEYFILPFKISENVSLKRAVDADDEKVLDALEKAGLKQYFDSRNITPERYITKSMHKNGIELSGGQNQRLLLARALYKDAPVLVLDEPTAALDPIAESEIYNSYVKYTDKKTAIFISHRFASTRFSDRIIMLEKGKVIEQGTHEELMQMNGRYAQMFEVQSSYYESTV